MERETIQTELFCKGKAFLKINVMFEIICSLLYYTSIAHRKFLIDLIGWYLINSSENIFSLGVTQNWEENLRQERRITFYDILFCAIRYLNTNYIHVINLVLPKRFVFCLSQGHSTRQSRQTYFYFSQCRNILLKHCLWNDYVLSVTFILPLYVVVQEQRIM